MSKEVKPIHCSNAGKNNEVLLDLFNIKSGVCECMAQVTSQENYCWKCGAKLIWDKEGEK